MADASGRPAPAGREQQPESLWHSIMGALALFGMLALCGGCLHGCFLRESKEREARTAAKVKVVSDFLEPSAGKVLVAEVCGEYLQTTKGHYAGTHLVYILQSPATGRRLAVRVALGIDQIPVKGETWLATPLAPTREWSEASVTFMGLVPAGP